jgi:hypothetical protein
MRIVLVLALLLSIFSYAFADTTATTIGNTTYFTGDNQGTATKTGNTIYYNINVNDWHSSLSPAVYVHNKFKSMRVRKYHRCSVSDLKKAIEFHFSKIIKGKAGFVYSY